VRRERALHHQRLDSVDGIQDEVNALGQLAGAAVAGVLPGREQRARHEFSTSFPRSFVVVVVVVVHVNAAA
jgi:hypothetical protein